MSEVRNQRDRVREEVIGEVKEYAKHLAKKKGDLKLIVLFGSYARGDWKSGSDVDLLVVATTLPETYNERWDLFHAVIDELVIEPHAYSIDEFNGLLAHGRMAALDPLTEGIVVYADPSYLEKVKRKVSEVTAELKLEKVGSSWIRRKRFDKTNSS
nr:nucleotidyltransferase domain-containing protein [Candidatus Njordarchaeota archaeon]